MAATPENDKDVEIKAQTLADNAPDERRKRLKQPIVLGKERGWFSDLRRDQRPPARRRARRRADRKHHRHDHRYGHLRVCDEAPMPNSC